MKKKRNNNKKRIFLWALMVSLMTLLVTGCEKREEFRHGHRHRIGDPPVVEQTPEEEKQEEVVLGISKPITKRERIGFAFDGLNEIYHPAMTEACEEIKADKSNIRNFILYSSSGDREAYHFDYLGTTFEVVFTKDGKVQYLTTVPADGLLYRDGCKGLDIADFCVDQDRIPELKAATEEAFEHGAYKPDFKLDYYWDKAQISRVYDYYIVRVSGKAIYNYTERRTEPQVTCELKDFGTVLNPRYFSVQNGERLEEFGQHEVPLCELEPKTE